MARSDDEGHGAARASTRATALLPGAKLRELATAIDASPRFAAQDPRSETGRRRGDSVHPLEIASHHAIGRFELIREIARGGMGQVFLGRDTKLGRRVAIKFLLRDDPHFVQRFVVEARATARCTHENIVTIFEVGEHEGLPYMVLEYLEGRTLSDVIETKPSVRQLVELMIPVARALERAHEHGIVHRDLKPSNIFVTRRGQVKVLDFGVARLVEPTESAIGRATAAMEAISIEDVSHTFTGSNSLVGTLPYMSPEQWGADEVDHLSDLWAFGIIFWRALIGKHPAGTMAPDALRARLCDLATPLPSLAAGDPSLSRELVAIVDRCLAKRKADRYPGAGALLADLEAFLAPSGKRDAGEVGPYRGLSAFGEGDAAHFFGRANEVRTALAQLAAWPLLVVIGPSGVGKSSFVHAGIVPAVRGIGGTWNVHVLRPGRAPLHRLAGVLQDLLATGEDIGDVAAELRDAPGMFGARLRATAAARREHALVIVDQLEELFTLCDDDRARAQFLAALLAAADDVSSPVRVVLSIRADFLDRMASYAPLLAELSRGLFFLTTPDRESLRETLVRPAELAGYAFEDRSIVEDIMEAATSRGALPLLSFAASRLWDARDRGRKLLTTAAYREMGGVAGAFARHADQVASSVPSSREPLLRAILTRLVTPDGTRAVIDLEELLSLSSDRREVEQILDQLVTARLVHLDTHPGQVATVEIVHEMLITEWPTLRRWLEDKSAMRGFLQELRQAAKQWATRGRPADLVWRGATAQEALALAGRHVLDLSAVEHDFLGAIRTQARRARRRKVLVVASIFATLGLVIAGGSVAVVRIQLAEHQAQQRASDAKHALGEAESARAELQSKLDIIETERKARAAEEQARAAEEAKRHAAEAVAEQAQGAEALSREELVKANQTLNQRLRELQVAKDRALAAQEAARKASDQAAQLLAQERARREKLERELQQIDQRELK